jgi:glutathione transport system substrate-binding protein
VEDIKYGGHIPFSDHSVPTRRHIHEWGYTHMKNAGPMFNGLIQFNPETEEIGDLAGDLAESWELLPDGLTYVFRLKDATWHDGKPVTAEDVAFSMDSLVCPTCFEIMKEQTRSSTIMIKTSYSPGNARAVDEKTVEITLNFPAPGFLPKMAIATLVVQPKHSVLDEGKLQTVYVSEDLNGSGPFKHLGYTKDVKNEYEKWDGYWKESYPRIDGMTHFIIKDPTSVIAAYKSGQVLRPIAISGLTPLQMLELQKDLEQTHTTYWAGPTGLRGLVLNTTKAPFNDQRVRHAISLAINRQSIIQTMSGGMEMLGTPLPPGLWFSYTEEEAAQFPGFRELNGEKHPEDIAEAKRLMEAAGYPDGFDVELATRSSAGGDYADIVALVAEQLKKHLNINATLKLYDSAAGYAQYDLGNFQFFAQGSSFNLADPDGVMRRYHEKTTFARWAGGGAVGQGWVPEGVQELHLQQTAELDEEKRKELILKINDIFVNEDNGYIGLYWSVRAMPIDNRIQGFHMEPTIYGDLKHEHIWCDPACN